MRVVNPQTSNDLVDAVSHTVCCGLVQLLQLYSCSLWDDRERVSSAGFIRVPELNRGMKACVMAPPPPRQKAKVIHQDLDTYNDNDKAQSRRRN